MESRKLEIILHAAKDLHDVKHFGTMDPYATLWIAQGDGRAVSKQRKTKVAKKAGSCPVWDYRVTFHLSSMNSSYTLFCEIKHDGKLLDRKIGEVRVPFTDLLIEDAPKERVSYPVKISSGQVNGEIILSHKFSELEAKEDGKVVQPKKKVKGKKKHGLLKKIAKNVASEAVLLAGTIGAALAGDYIINGNDDEDGDDGDEDEDEDEDGEGYEDEDEDEDEDVDEDEEE